MAKKKNSHSGERGQTTQAAAVETVEESLAVAAENEGGTTDEEVSPEVAEVRAADQADRSPATVQPTIENDNMLNDSDARLTPGQQANLDEDDERRDEADDDNVGGLKVKVADELPQATPAQRASTLQVNEDATAEYDAKKAANAVGIKEGMVLSFNVRGNGMTGKYLVVVDAQGNKHTIALGD